MRQLNNGFLQGELTVPLVHRRCDGALINTSAAASLCTLCLSFIELYIIYNITKMELY